MKLNERFCIQVCLRRGCMCDDSIAVKRVLFLGANVKKLNEEVMGKFSALKTAGVKESSMSSWWKIQ